MDREHQRLAAFEAVRHSGLKDPNAVAHFGEVLATWIARKENPALAVDCLNAARHKASPMEDLLTTAEVIYTFASKTPAPQTTPEPAPAAAQATSKRRFHRA